MKKRYIVCILSSLQCFLSSFLMDSLSILLSTSPFLLKPPKTNSFIFTHTLQIHSFSSKEPNHFSPIQSPNPQFNGLFLKSHLSLLSSGFFFPLSSLASEADNEIPSKINIEAILVSIDDFFNRYPFFVAGVTFIWLVVIPLTQSYLSKYKSIDAFDAFKKLRDDPNCQLLDIREKRSVAALKSPNLKLLNKSVVQVHYREGDEDAFVKQVFQNFENPENTAVCILDSFNGNSLIVAELLVKSGLKEAYAITGGIKGKKGWQEIQEKLLPPSVHIKKKVKKGTERQDADRDPVASVEASEKKEGITNGSLTTAAIDLPSHTKQGQRSSSPYPNYPDFKPPASPTPSKPED